MSAKTVSSAPSTSTQVLSGVAVGVVTALLAHGVLASRTGPSDGWALAFLIVLGVGACALVAAASPGWRAFGVTLIVGSLAPFLLLFLALASIGTAIGS